MAVAARFYVSEMTYWAGNPQAAQIKLGAVVRGPENAAWSAATPSGTIEMHVSNPDAVAWFNDRRLAKEEIALTFDIAPEVEDRKYS